MKDYDSQEELSDSEDPDLLAELQDLDVDQSSPQVSYHRYLVNIKFHSKYGIAER